MAVRTIVVVPHEALDCEAEEISDINDNVRALAKDMCDTMYKAPGLGLAANQVGEPVQLIVCDVVYPYAKPKDKKKDPLIIINPRVRSSEGECVKEEGCLSVPELDVEIKRAACVQVEGMDLSGKALVVDAEGILARVLQHEIDHLRGTTILDHASALKRSLYRRRIKKRVRRDK